MKILYITGPTRSGSTLLARLLNEYPGFVSVGEVVSLDVALQSSHLQTCSRGDAYSSFVPNDAAADAPRRRSAFCGCKLPVHDCPVWGRVEASVLGDPPDFTCWSWSASRPSFGRFLLGGAKGWLDRRTGDLGVVAERVYRELAQLTRARVLVDDSKTPLYGYFLASQPWADVVAIRLVRDPRGTAASWARPKSYPGIEGGRMPTHSAPVCSLDWLRRVVLADRLFEGSPLVRYEDLTMAPAEVTQQALEAAGVEAEPPDHVLARTVTFGTNHILAGNPDKFERGSIAIRPPSDWSRVIGAGSRAAVTALTFPYLRRYRYAPWADERA